MARKEYFENLYKNFSEKCFEQEKDYHKPIRAGNLLFTATIISNMKAMVTEIQIYQLKISYNLHNSYKLHN